MIAKTTRYLFLPALLKPTKTGPKSHLLKMHGPRRALTFQSKYMNRRDHEEKDCDCLGTFASP